MSSSSSRKKLESLDRFGQEKKIEKRQQQTRRRSSNKSSNNNSSSSKRTTRGEQQKSSSSSSTKNRKNPTIAAASVVVQQQLPSSLQTRTSPTMWERGLYVPSPTDDEMMTTTTTTAAVTPTRRTGTPPSNDVVQQQHYDLSSSSSSPSTAPTHHGRPPAPQPPSSLPSSFVEESVSSQLQQQQQHDNDDNDDEYSYLQENLIDTFLDVMPDRTRKFAQGMLKRANNNVERALCLALEETEPELLSESEHDNNNDTAEFFDSPSSSSHRHPTTTPRSATGGNSNNSTSDEHNDRHHRPSLSRLSQHEPSLTLSDVHTSSSNKSLLQQSDDDDDYGSICQSSSSKRFMTQFATEVPSFRRTPSPPTTTTTTTGKNHDEGSSSLVCNMPMRRRSRIDTSTTTNYPTVYSIGLKQKSAMKHRPKYSPNNDDAQTTTTVATARSTAARLFEEDAQTQSAASTSANNGMSSGGGRNTNNTAVASSSSNNNNNNLMALQKMARVATVSKQESTKRESGQQATVQRPSVHVGWNEDLFVVGGGGSDGDEQVMVEEEEERSVSASSPLSSPTRPSSSSSSPSRSPVVGSGQSTPLSSSSSPDRSPPRKRSSLDDMGASMPTLRITQRPPPLAVKRKNTLIVDKKKRDTRWQWAQALVSKTFGPYRTMLSERDDLLPDRDEFEAFEASGARADEDFEGVRDVMLDDYDLTEREVAAFFEGFALFNVKIRSLQSQLESLRAVSRSVEPRPALSKSRSANDLTVAAAPPDSSPSRSSLAASSPNVSLDDEPMVPSDSPEMLGKSLRALSIKKVQTEHDSNEEVQRLLKELEDADKKQKKLEKQLKQAGIIIAEDIPYKEAKSQVNRIARRMGEIGSSDVIRPDKAEQAKLREEYFKLEQDMEKFNAALMLTDEYIEEQEEAEQKWEDDHLEENNEALKKLRRHMPVNVKSMSEAELSSTPTPNGKLLPRSIAKKFKRTNVLQLIRTDPEDLVRMHPAALENLRVTGLTLTERRAIYAHMKDVAPRWKAMQAEKMTERKWTWFKMMKQNFKENLDIYESHVAKYGPPGSHLGCPLLGKQCPLKADKQIDYDGDYGFTDAAEYEVSNVRKSDKEDPGAKAKREAMELARDKKANERSVGLKKHYKGKVLQVSLANGSCESMDEMMDRIEMLQTKSIEERLSDEGEDITDDGRRSELTAFTEALSELKLGILHLAERSGMQLTGKKDANADQPDKRSPIELGLCEEVYESCLDFFASVKSRMKEIKAKDGRLKSTIDQLQELLDELHERNVATLKELGCKRPAPSRKHKHYKDLLKEAKAKRIAGSSAVDDMPVERSGPPPGSAGDRGGLMAAIAGRGGGAHGRGDLMSAIAGRGKGGRGRGRGDLLSAIAGRGRGGAPGRGPALRGRGDLLSAIQGRGRVASDGSEDLSSSTGGSGRRGSSNSAGRGGTGGRGDLLSAIAGRGKVD